MYALQPGFHQNYQPAQQPLLYNYPLQPLQQVIYSNKKLEHINCVIPETEDYGGLYIGDTISTLRPEHMTNNKIEAILCLNAEAARNAHLTRAHFDYKYIEIQDHPEYPIKLHFQSANEFIEKQRKNKKNVLVQCHAGVSRSATIICAYLVKHKSWIPEQAIYHLKQKRQRAKPNAGFWKQVEEYWAELNQGKEGEESLNFKTPTKVNKNLDQGTQQQSTKDHGQQSSRKQEKTTAVKSQKQLQTPTKIRQDVSVQRGRERIKSSNKQINSTFRPHLPQYDYSGARNKQATSLSKTQNSFDINAINHINRTVPAEIQHINNHRIYQSPQPVLQSFYHTPVPQTIHNPYMPQPYQVQQAHSFYSPYSQYNNHAANGNGFVRGQ